MERAEADGRIGSVVDGRYRILEPMASGAMGAVYRAERVPVGKVVAIKFLHAAFASDREFLGRFERETRVMSRLAHPHCVSVVDFGVAEGAPYLVMDFVAGVTLRELLYDYGGGSLSGRPIKAVQVGGPLGAWLPEAAFDTPIDYEAFVAAGGMLGHGGIVVVDDTMNMADMARYAFEFCAIESCGKCTPCRIGSTRGVEVVDRLRAGDRREASLELLHDLCHTMRNGSLCALGGLTPDPVESALKHFPEDFALHPATGATGTTG